MAGVSKDKRRAWGSQITAAARARDAFGAEGWQHIAFWTHTLRKYRVAGAVQRLLRESIEYAEVVDRVADKAEEALDWLSSATPEPQGTGVGFSDGDFVDHPTFGPAAASGPANRLLAWAAEAASALGPASAEARVLREKMARWVSLGQEVQTLTRAGATRARELLARVPETAASRLMRVEAYLPRSLLDARIQVLQTVTMAYPSIGLRPAAWAYAGIGTGMDAACADEVSFILVREGWATAIAKLEEATAKERTRQEAEDELGPPIEIADPHPPSPESLDGPRGPRRRPPRPRLVPSDGE